MAPAIKPKMVAPNVPRSLVYWEYGVESEGQKDHHITQT